MATDVPDSGVAAFRNVADGLDRTIGRFDMACRDRDAMTRIPQVRRELTELLNAASVALRADDRARSDEGARLLAEVRYAYSLHQTTWPAVIARERPEEFRDSAEQCTIRLASLIAWLRDASCSSS